MKRLMLIPAAGRGSRLDSSIPKVLFPVSGRPMIDHLLELYSPYMDGFILVLHPKFLKPVQDHCAVFDLAIEYALQSRPTGMLDAVLAPLTQVRTKRPRQVWITWCDQVAVHPHSIGQLAAWADRDPTAALILPTVCRAAPYIHLHRDGSGAISSVLQGREGDIMPPVGESDIGLFCLRGPTYLDLLPAFAAQTAPDVGTGERNLLPFLAWLQGRGRVRTFKARDQAEAIGVNDPHDLQQVEHCLAQRR